ncbi:MAG: hypothetical protein U0791_26980 [Gemmataceae bacterium]
MSDTIPSEPVKKPTPADVKCVAREYTYEELQAMVDEMLAAS